MADVVQSNDATRRCHGDDQTSTTGTGNRPKRPSTREKIAKMVADGAVNYPAYLKLIYTGDSEQEPSSSEDEFSVSTRTRASTADRVETRDIRRQRTAGDGDQSRCGAEQAQPRQSQPHQLPPRSSPESDKLMDDERETQATPTVGSPIDCHGKLQHRSVRDARGLLNSNSLFMAVTHYCSLRAASAANLDYICHASCFLLEFNIRYPPLRRTSALMNIV
jgi:hypothetical protein